MENAEANLRFRELNDIPIAYTIIEPTLSYMRYIIIICILSIYSTHYCTYFITGNFCLIIFALIFNRLFDCNT